MTISVSGSNRWPWRSSIRSEIAARSPRSPVNGSHEFDTGSSSAERVTSIAAAGSPRSVSRFSSRSASPVIDAATRSIPNPTTSSSRAARFISRSFR